MASFNDPKITNRIADDVPNIRALLRSLAQLTPDSGNTDYPVGTKRFAETANGYEFQQFNGTGWVTLEKWNIDAQKVDGHSASTGTTASTIPVRDANGDLPGNITGNAKTATKAGALSAVNPIEMGGTGANTPEGARGNLGVPPTDHSSTGTDYGLGNATEYGHNKLSDATDSDLGAGGGTAATPLAVKTAKAEAITAAATQASSALEAYAETQAQKDAAQDEAIAGKLDKSGGTMTGVIKLDIPDSLPLFRRDGFGSFWMLSDGTFVLRPNNDESADFWIYPDGRMSFAGKNIARSVFGVDADTKGNVDGTLVTASAFFVQRSVNDSFLMISGGTNYQTGAYLQLYGGDHSGGGGFTLSAGKNGAHQLIGNANSGNLYWKGWAVLTANSMPDYSAGVTVSSGFTAPSAGLYRHSGVNVSGNTYVNGILVDTYTWSDGSWAGHAGCTLLLSKGDVITYTGTAPSNRKFFPLKGA